MNKDHINKTRQVIEKHARQAYGFNPVDKITGTFTGGLPSHGEHAPIPVSNQGVPLVFLAEVDLDEIDASLFNLPNNHVLQMFSYPDDLFGVRNLANPKQDNHALLRVVSKEGLAQGEREAPSDFTDPLEFTDRVYYEPEKIKDFPSPNSIEYEMSDLPVDEEFLDAYYEVIEEENEGYPIVLGGYPKFTQEDFRDPVRGDDVFMLTLDSMGPFMWGDMGVASWWISTEDLARQDYSQAYLYWDCY